MVDYYLHMAQEKIQEQVELKEIQLFAKEWLKIIPINNLPPSFMHTLISSRIINVHATTAKIKRIIYFSHQTSFKSCLVLEKISNTGNYVLLIIDFDGNSFLLYKTRTTLKTYLLPFPTPQLSLNDLVNVKIEEIQEIGANPINYITKYFYGIPEPEEIFSQGNLVIFKLKQNRFTEFAFKHILKAEESYDEQYYNFYNHFVPVNSAWMSKLYFGNFRLLALDEECQVTHPEHPAIKLAPGYYILYHPKPREEEAD